MSLPVLYPSVQGCNPIHAVNDWCKVRALIRAAKRGDKIPSILIDCKDGNMLTGTHRAAANRIMFSLGINAEIEVVTLDDIEVSDELQEAVEALDYETIQSLVDE
jgi:hypothetical protein